MSADTFVPPVAPSAAGTQNVVTARARRADFGDGYTQRARDGLNFIGRTVTLSWEVLAEADYETIDNFFKAAGGADVFTYTLPLESVQYSWTCATWTPVYTDTNLRGLSATLVQEFDL